MTTSLWMMNWIDSEKRRLRMKAKAEENRSKPMLDSPDVQETGDYVFTKFRPFEDVGDSGPLFVAKKKSDRDSKYLVKHYYTDSAANEYVYTKLAQKMDLRMPNAVLFRLSEGEKRKIWHTEFILGTEFLDLSIEYPTYRQIREQAQNWEDFFRFRAMYTMCNEDDSFQIPLATDGCIYRIDTTDSFVLREPMFGNAGIMESIGECIPDDTVKRCIERINYTQILESSRFRNDFEYWFNQYGEECRKPYMDTFDRLLSVRDDYIDNFLNVLCYFYPDHIGKYYKKYISELKLSVMKFIKENSDLNVL